MKVDITTLKDGDQIYWNKGKEYYTGSFKKRNGDILDLKVIEVILPDGSSDEVVDIFLITKEEYDTQSSKVKTKKVKQEKERSEKVARAVKEKLEKVKDIKPNLNGLQAILKKNGGKIAKGEKWYSFCITQDGESYSFDYKGAVKDIFFAYEKEGLQGIKKLVGA